jgi:hypothetical protein
MNLDDANDVFIAVLERHKDADDWPELVLADFLTEVTTRGMSEHNARVLLNKLIDDTQEFTNETGTGAN